MSQFEAKRFARGVKVTIQHVNTVLDEIDTASRSSAVTGLREQLAPMVAHYTIPFIDAPCVENTTIAGYLPLIVPPFQGQFDVLTQQPAVQTVILDSLSISVDQRATQYAIVGPSSAHQVPPGSAEGLLAGVDMSRYDVTLRLLEKTPWYFSNAVDGVSEVLKIEVSGAVVFGADFAGTGALRSSPFLVSDLRVRIQPYKTYWWEVSCPGLSYGAFAGAKDLLAMPSWTLDVTMLTPLTQRDVYDAVSLPVQNLPSVHNGAATGQIVPFTPVVGGASITGTDVQSELGAFDATLRDRLDSGYGYGHGSQQNMPEALDPPPAQALQNDSAMHIIVVPMWGSQPTSSVQCGDVATGAILPMMPVASLDYAADRAILRVPANFALHQAFACFNYYSTPASWPAHTGGPLNGYGLRSANANYHQKVGVNLLTWLQGDNFLEQPVAYVEVVGGDTSHLVDRYDPQRVLGAVAANIPAMDLVALPIVWDVARTGFGYYENGAPMFMGDGSNKTAPRTDAATAPPISALASPYTAGQEKILDVRWIKSNIVETLADPAAPHDTVVGQLGEWVILVGKQTAGA